MCCAGVGWASTTPALPQQAVEARPALRALLRAAMHVVITDGNERVALAAAILVRAGLPLP
jgi:hypothetical protein